MLAVILEDRQAEEVASARVPREAGEVRMVSVFAAETLLVLPAFLQGQWSVHGTCLPGHEADAGQTPP